ncbi:hypothetical protein QBC41DRAFT_313762 [Cercophora samala]|uniref:Uncharacterized protein n=1 Tax=Cercophora samala TaxID=330535 RepID=A0AA39ZK14_9PEZI|nr:hypothetical protein QBC41DRAFT_313762 [Cercophora samala]
MLGVKVSFRIHFVQHVFCFVFFGWDWVGAFSGQVLTFDAFDSLSTLLCAVSHGLRRWIAAAVRFIALIFPTFTMIYFALVPGNRQAGALE